ncbi:hypothetical protein [Planococcus chinensis]|uniref:Uncharacterized protein n=1 Tax=Planococcus chinensis TaxID=272917 RepID=A0ABW4QGS4_9BACL
MEKPKEKKRGFFSFGFQYCFFWTAAFSLAGEAACISPMDPNEKAEQDPFKGSCSAGVI